MIDVLTEQEFGTKLDPYPECDGFQVHESGNLTIYKGKEVMAIYQASAWIRVRDITDQTSEEK